MKIGLLICDKVNIALRDQIDDYPKMFQSLFKNAFEWCFYDVVSGCYPKNIDDCDGYISTGSSYSVYDNEKWIVTLKDFIRSLYKNNKKFVGICFGHQMIAHALGGVVEKSSHGWGVGVKTNKIYKHLPWLKHNSYNVIVSHQDQITKLPANTDILAGNSHCPTSMIQLGESFLGIQGHPEFKQHYAELLLELRKDQIPAAVYQAAKASFNTPSDHELLANIIINFFLTPK